MAKDWPSKQPNPQPRFSTARDPKSGDIPTTGFSDAPQVGLPEKGAGKGVPPSNKKIR